MAHSNYVYNPDLSFVKPGYPGNVYRDGKFWNEDEQENASFVKFLKWRFTKNPQKAEKNSDTFRLQVIPNRTFTTSAEDMIVWLGHATFYIRINGISILTDPIFGDLPFMPRKSALPCEPSDLAGIDYLLISHGHRDHVDKTSIKQILAQNPEITVLAPLQMENLLRSFGTIKNYQQAGWYQSYKTADALKIALLPARHWHRRGMSDFNKILWGSFLIRSAQQTILFGGDSAYGLHFKQIREIAGIIDICILPVGAYKPPFMMQGSHMNPQEAVQAFHDLQGKVLIPMHYGTFDLSDEPLGEPIQILQTLRNQQQINGTLKDVAVGEEYRF